MKNLRQLLAEASSRPVTPERREVGLEVSSIDGVTPSGGDGRGERAQCRRYVRSLDGVQVDRRRYRSE
jgi:hypothetical protein